MNLKRIGLTSITTITVAVFTNIAVHFPVGQVWAQTTTSSAAEANRLLDQGIQQYQTNQFPAALQSWQQALTIYREIKNRQDEGKVLNNLGLAYLNLGNYAKAIESEQQWLTIARELHDRQGEGTALGNLGLAYSHLGNYAKATEYQQQRLSIVREIHDRQGEEAALGNLGLVYLDLGNYGKTIEYFEQVLTIAREIHDRESEGKALGNLGLAYRHLGNYAKAIEYQQQRLTIAREIHDRQGEGYALGNLGLAYLNLGNYAKAIEYEQQWLTIARELHDRQGEGAALGNLGLAYYDLGNYAKAIEYHQQHLAIARELHDRQSEGTALGNLGLSHYFLQNYAKAIEYEQQSLTIKREIHQRQDEGKALGNLGLVYLDLGNYAKAIEYHQQWLTIAREIHDRQSEGTALGDLGIAYLYLGNYAKAIECEQQWLTIAREIHDLKGEGLALNNLGLALQKSDRLPEAEKTLRASIQVWENLRAHLGANDAYKVSIFEQQARSYRTLQQVLIAEKQPNAALEIAERGRARAFVELLASHQSTPTQITPPSLQQLQQVAQQQQATLVEYSISAQDFPVPGKPLEVHEDLLYIWVIKPTGEITFRTSDLKPLWQKQHTTLDDLVTASRDAIGIQGRGLIVVATKASVEQNSHLKQLYQLLIQPIADLLPTDPNAHVIFLPQESLFLVPFPALQDNEGKYLIEQHTILTAPSIQVLQLTHQQLAQVPGKAKDILVVGNPTMPIVQPPGEAPQQLPQLPGTEQEAKDIAQLLHTQALIGNQASKAAVVQELPKAKMIHLATHGLLDDFKGSDVPGAIALGASQIGKPNDGLLTADEILNMKLNAQLVVLSACNTGQGKITGDGVVGLSRSLITAGVPSIVVSLWSVPDVPTASLMKQFYTNLQSNPDKAQALRQAMLTIMKQYPQPINWAAFTLIGEAWEFK